MSVQKAYDSWSKTYDTMANKTRDLEARALREILAKYQFDFILEIGCGTGKNTEFLISKTNQITAVDLSDEMLAIAKSKVISPKVNFIQGNILDNWTFAMDNSFDLISFSLVLEHIKDLDPIFEKAKNALKTNGLIYIGELHPIKQYLGTKARFEIDNQIEIVECYNHHLSEFLNSAQKNGFELKELKEQFDSETENQVPRILNLIFQKK